MYLFFAAFLFGGFVLRFSILVFCLFLLTGANVLWAIEPAAAASAKPNVAVLDFGGDKNVTEEQLKAIAGRLQAELMNLDAFTILDRSQMDQILKEQGFQQSGACTQSDCMVEMGQLLGVEKIITGQVVNFGEDWSVSVNYIDVGTGKVEQSISYEVHGKLIDVLKQGSPRGARMLVARVEGRKLEKGPLSEKGPSSKSQVTPQGGEKNSIEKREQMASEAVQGMKVKEEKSTGKTVLKYVLGGGAALLGAGGFVLGYLFNEKVKENYEVYNAGGYAKSAIRYEEEWKDVEQAVQARNISYAAGGLLLSAGFSIMVFF
jgi:hypothetical protein